VLGVGVGRVRRVVLLVLLLLLDTVALASR
jgi:hypothetical protein